MVDHGLFYGRIRIFNLDLLVLIFRLVDFSIGSRGGSREQVLYFDFISLAA